MCDDNNNSKEAVVVTINSQMSHPYIGSQAFQNVRIGLALTPVIYTAIKVLHHCALTKCFRQATHKEVVQLISGRDSVRLKVRSAGVIPVKQKRTEPVSWQMVSELDGVRFGRGELEVQVGSSGKMGARKDELHTTLSHGDHGDEGECPERRLYITMQGQHGLGCSICKVGPRQK